MEKKKIFLMTRSQVKTKVMYQSGLHCPADLHIIYVVKNT